MSPDVAASVRARLLQYAKLTGEDFERILARFAAERLIYRLGESAAKGRCLLKGASLLSVWLRDPYRMTRDVDLLATGRVDDEGIRALVEDICSIPCPEDELRFDLSEMAVETIRPDEEYSGKRVRFSAVLAKARIAVQLDVGVGDAVVIEPEEVTYPTLLSPLPAPRVRAYPRELTVAEKFEAMVKLETRNSRMKDFHDVWALAGAFAFTGGTLQRAVSACFERRGTRWTGETPSVLTKTFFQTPGLVTRWRHYLAVGAVLVPPPAQFEIVGNRIIQFLGPVCESIIARRTFENVWPPGGPWEAGDRRLP